MIGVDYIKQKIFYENKKEKLLKEEYNKALVWFGTKTGKIEVQWHDFLGDFYFPLMPFCKYSDEHLEN